MESALHSHLIMLSDKIFELQKNICKLQNDIYLHDKLESIDAKCPVVCDMKLQEKKDAVDSVKKQLTYFHERREIALQKYLELFKQKTEDKMQE